MAVLAVAAFVVVSAATVRWAVGARAASAPAQPPPTATPQAPGIVVASAHEDMAGNWLEPQGSHYVLFISSAFGDPRDNVPEFVGEPGHWSGPVDALPDLPAWAIARSDEGTTWQPEIHRFGSTYVMYFASAVRGTDPLEHCLGTAVSASVTGPYTPSAAPIVCQPSEGGDIDAQVVVDTTVPGHPQYLVWKSDNNAVSGDGTDRIWVQPLAADGLALTGSPTAIFGTTEAPAWSDPIVEAPQLVTSPYGGWWLFYSGGGGFTEPTDAIGVARCRTVIGPCAPVGSRPFVASNRQGAGVGEETFYRTATSDWLLYCPWHSGIAYQWFRPVEGVRIGWTPNGPYLAQAGVFPRP